MKTLILTLSLVALIIGGGHAEEPTIIISERPEWQRPYMEKVTFGVQIKAIDQILGKKPDISGGFWSGFLIFSCTAKENLGSRILWIDTKVEFSNGYVRTFKGIDFAILTKGTAFDIAKIPFETKESVSVKSVTITSVTIK